MWIFDTDHVSLVLRGNPKVIAQLGKAPALTSTTIITVQEIFNGWIGELNQPSTQRETILKQYHHLFLAIELLKKLPILEFDVPAFDRYEELLVQNPNLRKKRLQKDVRIAAIALSRNATVVTRNRRDFEQVPGLKIEDWTI
ncbi:MAG: type II toxin-antitoxin system VapC family toxin [Oscillatoriaceae cyanobacterium Prado104]|nr:type II toxin-antitoxin system VapC family toxin [Oscillatoriaceae cyanobacterium Prado104]